MAMVSKGTDLNRLKNKTSWNSRNITIYAYKVQPGSREQSIFGESSNTFVYLQEAIKLDAWVSNIEMQTSTMVGNNRVDGSIMQLTNSTNIDFLAKENVFEDFEGGTVYFTISKPLNIDDFYENKQKIYLASRVMPTEINEILNASELNEDLVQKLKELREIENITVYKIVDISAINEIKNSSVFFTFEKKPTNIKKITITYDRSFALHRVFGKGRINNIFTNIDFKYNVADNNFALMKMTPIALQNKLVCKSETLDWNISLPYTFIKRYNNISFSIRDDIIPPDNQQRYQLDLWRVFLSTLELTKAYSNGFAEYQITGTDGRSGVNPDATIGGIKIGLLSGISSSDAVNVISGRIEEWKTKHPLFINSDEFKVFKVYINMLTPFIQSNLSLGGGLNQMNKIDSLFYFDLRTTIVKGLANSTDTEITVQLKSSFYNINDVNNNLTVNDKFVELSQYQTLDLDGIVSFAEMPEELQEVSLTSSPGDKDPADENISKYYVYVPVDNQEKLKLIYGDNPLDVSTGWKKDNRSSIRQIDVLNNTSKTSEVGRLKSCTGTLPLNRNFLPADIPRTIPANSNPSLIYTKQYIYDQYIKPNLSSTERLNFISGEPDIRNIGFGYAGTSVNDTATLINCLGAVVSKWGKTYSGTYKFTYTDIYRMEFEYTVLTKEQSLKPDFTISSSTFDKSKYIDLVKRYYSQEAVNIPLTFSNVNDDATINSIDEIEIVGIMGNWFKLTIESEDADGNTKTFTTKQIEAIGKFNENFTKNKIYL